MNEMIILTAFPLWLFLWFFWPILTHWLQELFAKNVFLDILLFKLDLGQISFNPVENALPTQQLAFLATSIVFYHIVTRACAEIKIFDQKVTYVFRLFRLLDFFHLFSPFLFAAVTVELFAKKAFFFLLQWFSFYWACLRLKNFWVFHSTFWAFLCISKAPFGRSLWSGHHWEDLFLLQKYIWFWSKVMTSEEEERPRFVTGGTGVNGLMTKNNYITRCIFPPYLLAESPLPDLHKTAFK